MRPLACAQARDDWWGKMEERGFCYLLEKEQIQGEFTPKNGPVRSQVTFPKKALAGEW